MKVFISWSGDTSRHIAEALRDWLPMAIQAVKPYMNERDNEAGVRWGEMVSAELQETDFGILCLTPDNLGSEWLNFEAGALGKAVDRARVVPLLYKLSPANVKPPLGMFMGKLLNERGVKETLETMNKHLDPERHMDQAALDGAFKALWPLLQEKLNDVEMNDSFADPDPRKDRDILEEILELVRAIPHAYSIRETAGGTVVSELGSPQYPYWHTPTVITSGRPQSSLLDRLQDLFGPGISYKFDGTSVAIRGMPSNIQFSPEEERRFSRLVEDLQRAGINIAFQGHSNTPSEETESP